MTKFRRILLYTFSAFCGITLLLLSYLTLTSPDIPKLGVKEGDIVFQTTLGTQGYAIIFASKSFYTHMGFIKDTNNGPVVVEAIGPVKETPLAKWIESGVSQRLTVMRLKEENPKAVKKALSWAKKHYGKPYDIFFLPGRDSFYCSELVQDAFAEGAGISLGKTEKISDLHSSAAMDQLIKDRWQRYPLCKDKDGMTFEQCLAIIKDQELVTPASIARDSRLVLIYSNYPG